MLYHCLRSQIKQNSNLEVAQLETAYQHKKLTVNGPSTMQTASFCKSTSLPNPNLTSPKGGLEMNVWNIVLSLVSPPNI